MTGDSVRFRAGDTVRHEPTGETWILAVDQHGDDVYWAGWPEGSAKAKDCTILTRSTDRTRIKRLLMSAKMTGDDLRKSLARHQLDSSEAD